MLRRIMMTATLAGSLVLAGTPSAGAADPAPGSGSAFGQHVAHMAQEHAAEEGPCFGACVSAMATDATCPHTHAP